MQPFHAIVNSRLNLNPGSIKKIFFWGHEEMHYGRAAYCAVCFSRLDQWPIIKIKCRRLIESEIKSKLLINFLFLIIFFNGFQFLKGEIPNISKIGKKKIFFSKIRFRLEVPIGTRGHRPLTYFLCSLTC